MHLFELIRRQKKAQQKKLLKNIDVYFSTIDYAMMSDFKDKYWKKLFDYIIIDEAAQAINFSIISVLKFGKRVILAGDHK